MDTLVLLSKLLVLLSKIFSTGGFALTSTDKPLNIIFSFFCCSRQQPLALPHQNSKYCRFVCLFSVFSNSLSRLELQKKNTEQIYIYLIFQSMFDKSIPNIFVKFCNLDLIRKLLPIYTILADLFESCQIFVFIRHNLQRNST